MTKKKSRISRFKIVNILYYYYIKHCKIRIIRFYFVVNKFHTIQTITLIYARYLDIEVNGNQKHEVTAELRKTDR